VSEEKNTECVKGCFRTALDQLIRDLVKGDLSNHQMLGRWDKARGSDWVAETKLQQMSK